MIKLYFTLSFYYLISSEIIATEDHVCQNLIRSAFKLSFNSKVTECEIVSIKLNDHSKTSFKLSILTNNSVIESLYFHKTDSLLANSQTPVYLTDDDSLKKMYGSRINKDYKFIKSNIQEYVEEMGDFRFYHNYNRTASIIVFFKKTAIQLEGNIGHYILRCLPPESYPEKNKYVYAKLIFSAFQKINLHESFFDTSSLSYNLYVQKLEIINCKLFIMVHPSSINDKSRVEVMRTLLMFYNHLDMFFGNFTSPKIRLTLKGILLPDIGKPILYEGNRQLDLQLLDWSYIDTALESFIKQEKNYFQLDSHDKVYLLSQSCFGKVHVGFKEPDGEICHNPATPKISGVVHGDFQTYHIIHLQYLARMFGGQFVQSCDSHLGILYHRTRQLDPPLLVWSSCTIDGFSSYFNENDCSYFNKEKPLISTVMRDSKDERLRLAIELGIQTRRLYKTNKNLNVGLNINITYDSKNLMCSCVA